jgi:hypothetical protein
MAGAFDGIINAVLRPGTGTDPNSNPEGAVLRDRFHQMRGSGHVDQLAGGHLDRLAQELVTSRGAPVTPENVQMAREYLQGGALGKFDGDTEALIADEAIASERNAPAATAPAPPLAGPSPMPRAPAAAPGPGVELQPSIAETEMPPPPGTEPFASEEGGGGPTADQIAAALAVAAGSAATAKGIATNRAASGITGAAAATQAARDQAAADAVNAAADPDTAAPQAVPARATEDTGTVPQSMAGRGQANAAASTARAEDAAIPTEDVVAPSTNRGRKSGDGSVDVNGEKVEYEIYTSREGVTLVTPDGQEVKGDTLNAARRALRGAL